MREYEARMLTELGQLAERRLKLRDALDRNFCDEKTAELLEQQYAYMLGYESILIKRLNHAFTECIQKNIGEPSDG